jgi:hypothetical protein
VFPYFLEPLFIISKPHIHSISRLKVKTHPKYRLGKYILGLKMNINLNKYERLVIFLNIAHILIIYLYLYYLFYLFFNLCHLKFYLLIFFIFLFIY